MPLHQPAFGSLVAGQPQATPRQTQTPAPVSAPASAPTQSAGNTAAQNTSFFKRPEVRAGLLQLGVSLLTPGANPGSALADAFGATGRYSKGVKDQERLVAETQRINAEADADLAKTRAQTQQAQSRAEANRAGIGLDQQRLSVAHQELKIKQQRADQAHEYNKGILAAQGGSDVSTQLKLLDLAVKTNENEGNASIYNGAVVTPVLEHYVKFTTMFGVPPGDISQLVDTEGTNTPGGGSLGAGVVQNRSPDILEPKAIQDLQAKGWSSTDIERLVASGQFVLSPAATAFLQSSGISAAGAPGSFPSSGNNPGQAVIPAPGGFGDGYTHRRVIGATTNSGVPPGIPYSSSPPVQTQTLGSPTSRPRSRGPFRTN